METYQNWLSRGLAKASCAKWRLQNGEGGQGTTEYAVLVGVIVLIAILAIPTFSEKIQTLWDEIANGINDL